MPTRATFIAMAVGICVSAERAGAQSLFLRNDPGRVETVGKVEQHPALRSASLMFVEEPKPRVFGVHDLVTIIVDESSVQQSKSTLDTKKDYTLKDSLNQFPSLQKFLEFELRNGMGTPVSLDVTSNNKFKGEGTYDRSDKFTAKVSATIIDVKPNGVLVLEARKSRTTDDESQTLVLSGTCRQEDITTSNTVLSSQIADLTLVQKNEGQVKDSATKGFIPRILEAIFNF